MKQPDLAVQNCVAERMCMGEDMDDVSLFHGYAIDGTVTDISFVVLALRSAAARQLQGTATQHVFEVERTVGHVQIALGI